LNPPITNGTAIDLMGLDSEGVNIINQVFGNVDNGLIALGEGCNVDWYKMITGDDPSACVE